MIGSLFTIISKLFTALSTILGMVERKQERDTGAALQREKDLSNEIDRITKAVEAGNDPKLDDLDRVSANDPNNRDNLEANPASVQNSMAPFVLQPKEGQPGNRRRNSKAKRKA